MLSCRTEPRRAFASTRWAFSVGGYSRTAEHLTPKRLYRPYVFSVTRALGGGTAFPGCPSGLHLKRCNGAPAASPTKSCGRDGTSNQGTGQGKDG